MKMKDLEEVKCLHCNGEGKSFIGISRGLPDNTGNWMSEEPRKCPLCNGEKVVWRKKDAQDKDL